MDVIDQLAKIHVPLLYFSGGEPLVNKDHMKLFEYAKKKKMICVVDTNATLITKDIARRFVDMKFDVVTLSLHGPEKVHNVIMNDRVSSRNNFKRAVKGIRELMDARGEYNLPIVKINCVMSSLNYRHLKEVYKIAKELKVDMLDFANLSFIDEPTIKLHTKALKDKLNLDDKSAYAYLLPSLPSFDWDKLYKDMLIINKWAKKDKMAVNFYPSYTREQLIAHYTDLSFSKIKACIYPWFFIVMRPNGDVTACSNIFFVGM